jgi:hypothetical protein
VGLTPSPVLEGHVSITRFLDAAIAAATTLSLVQLIPSESPATAAARSLPPLNCVTIASGIPGHETSVTVCPPGP